jgi:hypothetical protein
MMIKQIATFPELEQALDLVQRFLTETSYGQAIEAATDREYLGRFCFNILKNGYIWLAVQDGKPVGILMAIVQPNMWSPKHREMRELLWYVAPEARTSSLGGRLFVRYQKTAEQLKSQGLINGYFTTRMATTRDINLEGRGFRLTEQTYIKE